MRPGHTAREACGLAIDVGTTTIAVQLVRLADGQIIETATSYNQQIRRGADIISRIDYARTAERLDEVRTLVLDTINGLIAGLPVHRTNLKAAFLAGNTTMTHLLLGLPPRYIRESPYVPTVQAPARVLAGRSGIEPRARCRHPVRARRGQLRGRRHHQRSSGHAPGLESR